LCNSYFIEERLL